MRRLFGLPAFVLLAACGNANAESGASEAAALADGQPLPQVVVYKTPTCGCCGGWVEHMRQAGFTLDVRDLPSNNELMQVKIDAGVPGDMTSCHTSIIDGYVVEGHVPADQIKRMLAERPSVAGIAAPGMPAGSPGMDQPNAPPYDIIAWNHDGAQSRYAEIVPR